MHESALPEQTRKRLLAALKNRKLDASLLYSGLRQTSRWISLHRSVAPILSKSDYARVYHDAFAQIAGTKYGDPLHVIGLGCGDGSKDTECLRLCREAGKTVIYTPCDISMEMALTAHRRATQELPGLQSNPLMCDLTECSTLPGILKSFDPAGLERVLLFLGTLHNGNPLEIFKALLPSLRSTDSLVLSANLARAEDYEAHLECILKQYDNEPTRHWLFGALSELGIYPHQGELGISIQPSLENPKVKQIEARFTAGQVIRSEVLGEPFVLDEGESLSVFGSRRFTPADIHGYLSKSKLKCASEYLTAEEGVWICRRA